MTKDGDQVGVHRPRHMPYLTDAVGSAERTGQHVKIFQRNWLEWRRAAWE